MLPRQLQAYIQDNFWEIESMNDLMNMVTCPFLEIHSASELFTWYLNLHTRCKCEVGPNKFGKGTVWNL